MSKYCVCHNLFPVPAFDSLYEHVDTMPNKNKNSLNIIYDSCALYDRFPFFVRFSYKKKIYRFVFHTFNGV